MKKIITLFLLSTISITINAQIKRVTVSELKIQGLVKCVLEKGIDLDKGDTSIFFYIGFQNEKYTAITDIRSILLPIVKDSSEVYGFLKSLKAAYNEMDNKQTISWNKELYSLYLYDFNKDLYLGEAKSRGSAYTTLSKKNTEKLIAWFESLGFKK